jgi:hypothetical protein
MSVDFKKQFFTSDDIPREVFPDVSILAGSTDANTVRHRMKETLQ